MSQVKDLGLIAERKVQMGATTQYVSLPKIWCKAHEVQKGSVLEIYLDSESRLVIRKKLESELKEEVDSGKRSSHEV